MNILRAKLPAVALLALGLGLLSTSSANAGNIWEQYRFPFRYNETWGMSQGWNGAASHTAANGLYYAIDMAPPAPTNDRPAFSADEGYATCQLDSTSGFGYYVRVTHGSNSSLYGHLVGCSGFTSQNVIQGYGIGTAGCTGTCTGTHIHFQVNTTTTSTIAASYSSISGINPSSFNNGGHDCPTGYGCPSYPQYTSDNNGAGYDTNLSYYSSIHDGYVANGGYSTVGSSANAVLWAPCDVATAAVFGCSENGYAGLVETFIGASGGAYSGYHAVLKGNSVSATVFMSRGFLGGYTDTWGAGHDGLWFAGYPTGNSFWVSGSTYQMNFQNGYATFNSSTCASSFYYWDSFLGHYVLQHTASYCD